jgi:polysaccharide export outer membrane protein
MIRIDRWNCVASLVFAVFARLSIRRTRECMLARHLFLFREHTMRQRLAQLAALTLFQCFILLVGVAGIESGAHAQSARQSTSSSDYLLGPNDRVRVKVYGEQDITGEYEIDSNGYVSVPLAGRMKAAGRTARQLERTIAAELSKGIIRDPRVNVEIAAYRPFYILGEVKKAGEYPYRNGLTVLDAVASAGGYTYRANENKVFLRRAGSTVEEVYALDAPVPIYPGDNIRIPERYF